MAVTIYKRQPHAGGNGAAQFLGILFFVSHRVTFIAVARFARANCLYHADGQKNIIPTLASSWWSAVWKNSRFISMKPKRIMILVGFATRIEQQNQGNNSKESVSCFIESDSLSKNRVAKKLTKKCPTGTVAVLKPKHVAKLLQSHRRDTIP